MLRVAAVGRRWQLLLDSDFHCRKDLSQPYCTVASHLSTVKVAKYQATQQLVSHRTSSITRKVFIIHNPIKTKSVTRGLSSNNDEATLIVNFDI